MKLITRIALLFALVMAASAFAQQNFPNRPIRLVIGSVPGGGNDIVGRMLARRLSETLGQQMIVDNRGGANGIIGMEIVMRAPPDGYTIFMGTTGHLSVNPVLYKQLPFNMEKDFTPLTEVVSVPFLLYVHPSFPPKTLAELIANAKANPGKVLWYSSGDGGLPRLTGELLNMETGMKTTRIPYKGSAPGFNDLLGGQVQYGIDAVAIGLQQVKAGRLRALATTSKGRLPFLPDVPAMSETLPNFEVVNWYGMVLPAGTPRAIVNRLHSEFVKAMNVPEIREKLVDQATFPVGSTPEEFGKFRKAEEGKWAKVIKQANIPLE